MKIQPTVLAVTRQCWVPWLVLTKDTEHSRGPPWLVSADDSGESGTEDSVDSFGRLPEGYLDKSWVTTQKHSGLLEYHARCNTRRVKRQVVYGFRYYDDQREEYAPQMIHFAAMRSLNWDILW